MSQSRDNNCGRRTGGGNRVGYTRVSTVSQTLDQQNAALEAAGVTRTFSDVMSGARDERPGLAALMDYVRPGDTVVVWKLDRLGRNTLHNRDAATRKLLDEEQLQARFEVDLLGLIGNDRDDEAEEMTFEDWLRESTFLYERLTATTTFCESPG